MIAFEWDTDKARTNVRKHSVTFEEARKLYDPDHSDDEERELLIAHSNQGRILIVSYTIRNDVIRIISARKSTKSEETRYAQGI